MILLKVLKAPFVIIGDIVKCLVTYMPGSMGNRLRILYYRNKFKKCGSNVIIDVGVQIEGAEFISLGDNVHIDKFCIISTGKTLTGIINRKQNISFKSTEGEIVIGNNIHITQFCIIMGFGGVHIEDNCVLSASSKIYSLTNTSYDLNDRTKITSIMPYNQAHFLISPVVLNYNVWLGINSILMPGTHIGKNSFTVSNSVLMGQFPENSYIAGQPAKRIRDRFETSQGAL